MAKPLVLCVPFVVVFLSVFIAWYPSRRVLQGYEIMTDGWMPDVFTHCAQELLASFWTDLFHRSLAEEHEGQVTHAMGVWLNVSDCHSLLELAAGGGVAPTHWAQRLREGIPDLTLLLTDLQPNEAQWDKLRESHGDLVAYANTSVDATNVRGTLPQAMMSKDCGVRMIHLALHHFPPDLVRFVLADVVRSRSAVLIADIAPNLSTVFWLQVLTNMHVPSTIPSSIYQHFWELLAWGPVTPLMAIIAPLLACYDATVSALRAYSSGELLAVLNTIPGGDTYEAKVMYSKHAGDALGVPRAWQRYFLLEGPMIQYVWLAPRVAS